MAFDPYERRVLPQGQVASVRNVGGQVIGESLQQVGQAVNGAVVDVARAEQIQQQKNDSAWLGEQKPQSMMDLDAKLKALNDPNDKANYVDPTSDGYEAAVGKTIDDYSAEAAKKAPSPDASTDITSYLTGLKATYVRGAGDYSDSKKLGKRLTQIGESERKWGALVVTTPDRYDEAVKQQEDLIRSQGLTPDKTEAAIAKTRSNLATFAMNGEASDNPQQFKANIAQWGEKGADPSDIARAQNIADAEIDRRRAEGERKAREAETEAKANFGIVYDDAISTAKNTGTQKAVTDATIDQHYTGAAAEVLKRKLHTAEAEGMARIETGGTTHAEDEAWLAANAPKPGRDFGEGQAAVFKARADAIDDKRKALATEVSQDIKDSENDAQATVAKNFPDWSQEAANTGITDEMRTAVSDAFSGDPVKRKSVMDALEQSVTFGNQLRGVQTSDPEEDEDQTNDLTAASKGGPGSAAAQDQLDAMAKAITAKRASFAGDDPAGAAMATSPALADSWSQWQDAASGNDPAAPDYLRSAIAQSQAEQQRQNVPPGNRKPLPDSVATSIVGQINAMPTPKDQLQSLMQYVDLGGSAGQSVLAQLTGMKGGLPNGTDMIVDMARTDPVKAERVYTALRADTKGVTLPSEGQKAIASAGQQGLIGVLATQGDITGNYDASAGMAGRIVNTAEQYAKAKVMLGTDPTEAGQAAYSDLASPYALINDRSMAVVYYPADIEKQAPGAMEAGLQAERKRVAEDLRPLPSAPIVSEMKLTPQEQFLYQWHVNNITGKNGGKSFKQPNGATSTVLQMIEPVNGKWYSIPSVWDGKPHTEDQAYDHAEKIGWEKFPSYATQDAGQKRYDQMHAYMERDVDAKPNPYVEASIRDIGASAVWVNDGSGFSLIMPGSNRSLGFLTYAQAKDAGLKAQASGATTNPGYVNPARPQNLGDDDTPYFMKNPVGGQ